MGKKKIVLSLATLAVVALVGTGCSYTTTSGTSAQSTYQSDTAKVENAQEKMQKAVPIPEVVNSVERQNIAARAKLFDDQNKITYVYLVSYGKVMAFYTVKGKVSSLNSYMTPEEKLVFADGSPCDRNKSYGGDGADSWEPCYAVSSPDIDGAYGVNSSGVFFFTTDGAYVEWKGDYMVSDQPLQLSTPAELVRTIK